MTITLPESPLHLRVLLLAPAVVLTAALLAPPAQAVAAPTVGPVSVVGNAPGNVVKATGAGFRGGAVITVTLDGTGTSVPLDHTLATSDGVVTLSPGTRIPPATTLGTYRLTMTQPGGRSAASPTFTLVPPSAVLPAIMQAGQPADQSDDVTPIRLRGLTDGPGVGRTVTVDGVRVDTDWTDAPGATNLPDIAFAVSSGTGVGAHQVTFTQTGPTPYTVTGTVRVLSPELQLEGSPTSSAGRLGVAVFDPGWDDVVDLQIVGAAGDVHSLPLAGDDSDLGAVITLSGVSAGLATMTSVSRHNGATATATFTVDPTTISSPTGLAPGHRLVNADGDVQLVMQTDGNLVLYSYDLALWNTHTSKHPGAHLALQSDGNAVVYDVNGRALWNSGTSGIGAGARLGLDADDNAVITTSSGRTAWSNFAFGGAYLDVLTANHYLFKGQAVTTWDVDATMQGDGNFVVHVSGTRVAWSTRTAGHPNAYVVLQSDGNLVLHAANGAVLWANYAKATGARLVAQSDGNVVEYASNGKAVWSTRTSVG